jgi:hypothetical protein
MRVVPVAFLVFALAACSSSSGGGPTSANDTGTVPVDTGSTEDTSGTATFKVGDVLPDLDLRGYVRNESTGLATSVPLRSFKMSEALAAGTQRYIFIYDAAWWCSPCKQATQLVIGKLAANGAKAQFIEILIEGVTPTTPTTPENLDSWINALSVPFTSAIDADPTTFTTKKTYGIKETTYIVERSTMKIVAKEASAAAALTTLDTLP